MQHALYTGSVEHRRQIPKSHGFRYSLHMWFFNLDRLGDVPQFPPWFALEGGRWAINRFSRRDYLGDPAIPLGISVRQRMVELTGEAVSGEVFGLINLRTLGLYFSPVNFYYGYDRDGNLSHFLAEVSNTPWNQRHHYAYRLFQAPFHMDQDKHFHVSPFNPLTQRYRWSIEAPGKNLAVTIEIEDQRGEIFAARLRLQRQPLSRETLLPALVKKPVMTAFVVGGIYLQALKIYLKGIPYIPYRKEAL